MNLGFQADADFNEQMVSGILRRAPEIDFRTARAANLAGLSDLEVLEVAARDNRLLVTHDWETMPYHFGQFVSRKQSPGVLVVPQQFRIAGAIEEILLIFHASAAEEYVNSNRRIPL